MAVAETSAQFGWRASSLYGSRVPKSGRSSWDGRNQYFRSLIIVCLIGLVALSFFRVFRESTSKLWLYSHIFMALGVIIFGFMHSIGILVMALVWWFGPRPPIRGHDQLSITFTAATLIKLTEDLVEIPFASLRAFLIIPASLSSCRFPTLVLTVPSHHDLGSIRKDVTFHIRALGNWSRRLVELAGRQNEARVLLEFVWKFINETWKTINISSCCVCQQRRYRCDAVSKRGIDSSGEHGRPASYQIALCLDGTKLGNGSRNCSRSEHSNQMALPWVRVRVYGNVASDDTEVPSSESETESGVNRFLSRT
jgi:hypothetical protein